LATFATKTDVQTDRKAFVTLRFAGDDLDPREISAILPVAPTRAHRKGEEFVAGPRAGKLPGRTGIWFLATDKIVRSDDLGDHLAFVQKLLYPEPNNDRRIEKLRDILARAHSRARITCFWRGDHGETAPQIPVWFKSAIETVGAEIETDFEAAVRSKSVRAIARLNQQILTIEQDLPALSVHLRPSDIFGHHLLTRLRIAHDNAHGALILARNGLGPPLITVTRSLFDSLFSTYWATLNSENAQTMMNYTQNETFRILRDLLTKRVGIIRHRQTGEDLTTQFLQERAFTNVKRPPRFDIMAKQAGIAKIYNAFYGMFSMFAHGNATDLLPSKLPDDFIASVTEAARSLLQCLHLIVGTHIRHNQMTSPGELSLILGIKL